MDNLNAKCRTCLKEEDNMNLFYFSYDGSTTFAKMLEDALGMILKEEEYSSQICKDCTQILIDFTNFKSHFKIATEYFNNVANQFSAGTCFKTRQRNERKDCKTEQDNNVDSNSENIFLENSKQNVGSSISESNFEIKLNFQEYGQGLNEQKKIVFKEPVQDQPLNKPQESIEIQKCCKICKQHFLTNEYDLHFETHKLHSCKVCGHRFIRKTDLNDHEEIHLNIYKYVCQHCGKAFKVRTALNKHRRIHTHPREEICEACGQRFNTRDTLKTHYKLKHTKSKDFYCNQCGLGFTLKSSLAKHIERHNPNRQRTYSCDLCDASYINKYTLSRHHVIKHTSFEKMPSCQFCEKKYTKKVDLVKHIRKHHAQTNEPHITKDCKTNRVE